MVDLTEIQHQVEKVLSFSYYGIKMDASELMQNWAENKRHFMPFFPKGKLIMETDCEVSFSADEEYKLEQVEKFAQECYKKYDSSLGSFIEFLSLNLYSNIVPCEWNNCGKTVPGGMKIGKAIRKFWKEELSEKDIEALIVRISTIIQEDKIHGVLCFSIHPLDYLSLSENNHNWRSCHALDGDYRAGNLSYMQDNCTVVAYLRSYGAPVVLPHFPESVLWNNKKWRRLFFFDKVHCLWWAGREYPCALPGSLEAVIGNFINFEHHYLDSNAKDYYDLLMTEDAIAQTMQSFSEVINPHTHETYSLAPPHLYYNYRLRSLEEMIEDYSSENANVVHYNDLLRSSCYKPVAIKYRWGFKKYTHKFQIGHDVKCLHCNNESVYDSDTYLCGDCLISYDVPHDGFVPCSECGRMESEDRAYFINMLDDWVCRHCYEDYYETCAECERVFARDGMIYDEEHNKYFCSKRCQKNYYKPLGDDPAWVTKFEPLHILGF